MPRELSTDVKRKMSVKLLSSVMENLDYILASDIVDKPEYERVSSYGLMKAAFALSLKETEFTPNTASARGFINELLAAKYPELPPAVETPEQ